MSAPVRDESPSGSDGPDALVRGGGRTGAASAALPIAVAAVPAMSAVVLWRPGYDVFMTVKATVVVLGALAVLACGLVALARSGRLVLPSWPIAAAIALYVGALLLATAAAERPLLAVVGRSGRHVGLAVALAAVVLLLAAAATFRDRRPTIAVAVVLIAAVGVLGYGAVQAIGADPFRWGLVEGGPPVFSTLGNSNFLSAWLGIATPLAAWAALAAPWHAALRVASGTVGVLALTVAGASGSLQGVVAGLAGLLAVVVCWALGRRRRARALIGGLGAVGALAAWAAALAPPGLVAGAGRSLTNRLTHWETAWRMASERPWRGVGLAMFSGWFRIYESPEQAAARGLERGLDSPHSVPLELLATGGWPLLVGWSALCAAIVWALARALRRAGAERRLLLVGLAGAWGAYLLTGLVSIDVPPLAALGWTLAGMLVAASGQVVEVRIPVRAARPVALALLLALSPLAIGAVAPLRADLAAARGLASERADDVETAGAHLARAASLAPWEAQYASLRGAFLNRHGDREASLAAYEEAHRRDPRAVTPLLNIARLSLATGDDARARSAYDEAVRVAPHAPEVLDEAARNRP